MIVEEEREMEAERREMRERKQKWEKGKCEEGGAWENVQCLDLRKPVSLATMLAGGQGQTRRMEVRA